MNVLNIKETADLLRVSVSTIRKLVKNNELAHFRVAYRLFFTREAIEDFIRKQELKNQQKIVYAQNEIKGCKNEKILCAPLPNDNNIVFQKTICK